MSYPIVTGTDVAHCPTCNVDVALRPIGGASAPTSKFGYFAASISLCPRCKSPFLFLGITEKYYTQYQIYPECGHRVLHESVPENVKKVFREVEDVRSISPRCVPLICRALLEEIVSSTGIPDRVKLGQKVREYLASVDMNDTDIETFMNYIVETGNDAAHKIDDKFVPTDEECEYIMYATEEVFRELYERPAKAKTIKERGKKQSTGTSE